MTRGFTDDFELAIDRFVLLLVSHKLILCHVSYETMNSLRCPQHVRQVRAIFRHKSASPSKGWGCDDKDSGSARWPNGLPGPLASRKSPSTSIVGLPSQARCSGCPAAACKADPHRCRFES